MTASRMRRPALWLALLLLALLPAIATGSFFQYMAVLVFIYSIVAIGLNILAGYGGQISLGHAALMAMGAYTSALVSKGLATVPLFAATGLHVWVGMICGTLVAAAFGALLAFPALRVKGPYLAVVTIAFGWVIWKILLEWVSVTGGELGITAVPKAKIGSFTLTTSYFYYFALASMIAAAVMQRNLIRSEFGRRLQAVKHSEIAAASVGISVYGAKVSAFIVSAAFAGFGGALFAHHQNFVNPDSFEFFTSVFFLLAVLFGGAGTLIGPMIGATVLTLLPELLQGIDHYRLIVYGGFILITLYAVPNGVAGVFRQKIALASQASRDFDVDGAEAPMVAIARSGPQGTQHAALPLLEVQGVSKRFGGLSALSDFSFAISSGQVHAVIGPNGAGKTTLVNVLSGFYQRDSGVILIDGKSTQIPSLHRAARLGIARTFQTIKLFGDMSVVENVMVGFECHSETRLWDSVLRTRRGQRAERLQLRDARALIDFVGLEEFAFAPASALSYGHRRLLEIARAMATRPRVLLLDEPAAGLISEEIDALKGLIESLRRSGIGVLLVEHHMDLVVSVSDHVTVLDYGEVIARGSPAEIQRDPRVVEAYLGVTDDHAES